MIPVLLALHTMAAVIWVGGIFHTLHIFRPSTVVLGDHDRLEMWKAVLHRFFLWVWASIAVILVTGYGVVLFGYEGFAALGRHIQIMQFSGLLMIAIFVYLWTRPWHDFVHAVDRGHVPDAQHALARIGVLAKLNLVLGLLTASIGATGGFWAY